MVKEMVSLISVVMDRKTTQGSPEETKEIASTACLVPQRGAANVSRTAGLSTMAMKIDFLEETTPLQSRKFTSTVERKLSAQTTKHSIASQGLWQHGGWHLGPT